MKLQKIQLALLSGTTMKELCKVLLNRINIEITIFNSFRSDRVLRRE